MHQRVRLKYEGDINGIDANTLLPSLMGFVSLVQEVNRQLETKAELKIYVQSTDSGSFLIDFNIILDIARKLLSFLEGDKPLDKILYVVTGLIVLKLFLKNEEPKEVKEKENEVQVLNFYGEQINIDKVVYSIASKSETVDKSISQMFEPPCEDESVSHVSIQKLKKDRIKQLIKVSRDQMPYLIHSNPLLGKKLNIEIKKNQVLTVLKAVLSDVHRKWEFIYQGIKISAFIEDKAFLRSVAQGIHAFRSGTKLLCDLKIEQVYDSEYNTFINTNYSVLTVHKVIQPPTPRHLF